MIDDRKEQALAAWRKLLEKPEIRMEAEEQYDELLKLADEFKRAGVIDGDDRGGGRQPFTRIGRGAVGGGA